MARFTGIDSFDAELSAFMNKLASTTRQSVEAALGEAREILKQKIITEVENDDVYKPKVYKRRSEKAGRGAPLSDMDAYSQIIEPVAVNANGNLQVTSRLYYNPKGTHRVARWNTADTPNELIGRIEKKDPPYTWEPKNGEIPARPFWQHFVNQMVDEKDLERFFISAMNMYDTSLDIQADGDLVRDGRDGTY